MKFSVCVPASRPDTLAATIRSIQRQTYRDWELIIVGQGDDATIRAVTEAFAGEDRRIRFLHTHRLGASAARNAGMAAGDGEVFAFTDDDCEAREDWLEAIAEKFEAHPDAGLVGGAVVAPPKRRRGPSICPAVYPVEAMYDPVAMRRRPPAGWDWIGANHAFRRAVAELVGGYDEHLGPGATFAVAEDTDLKLRLESLGIKMLSTPDAVVRHTYGHRYGIGPRLRFSKNYARGNGGLAGKLTLAGDPRGEEWVRLHRREIGLVAKRPYLVASKVLRVRNFMEAYRQCLREFRVEGGLLVRRALPERAVVAQSREGSPSRP
ncbi:MAG: glycosyltransferase family 2 protein [Dehalococcoidia bacterium]